MFSSILPRPYDIGDIDPITSAMNDIERQLKLEADAVHDGAVRYSQSREYQLATGSKPVRDLVGNSMKPLADAILREQLALKERQKLPKYGVPLLSINHEKLALITIGTLLNVITMSEFSDGIAPGVTAAAYEIGQRCRLERIFDCLRQREVDIAHELRSRNRNRNAGRRAAELARKLDDDDDWAKNYRSFHLGEKLIALAVRFAEFEGSPVFELMTVRESDARRTHRIALTRGAGDWIATNESALASLSSPVHLPMIMPPRPWTSLSGGGYLVTPLNLLKRQANRRAQQVLEKADLGIVFSAVNAMQNTGYRINKDIYQVMRKAWDSGNLVFGLRTHTFEHLPPRLPDGADPKQIKERKRERAGAFNVNNRIKGLKKIMAFRLSTAERLLDEPQFYFPYQLVHRGRAYPVLQLIN